jgi:hypothetical protein
MSSGFGEANLDTLELKKKKKKKKKGSFLPRPKQAKSGAVTVQRG